MAKVNNFMTTVNKNNLDNSLSIEKGLFSLQSYMTAGLLPLSNMAIDSLNDTTGINDSLSLYSYDSVNKLVKAPVYNNGLIAEYLFQTNSNDTSGNAYNGTDTNVSYSTDGKVGKCATFVGTGYSLLTANTALKASFVNTTSFSIAMWFKVSSTASQDLFRGDKGNNARVAIILRSEKLT